MVQFSRLTSHVSRLTEFILVLAGTFLLRSKGRAESASVSWQNSMQIDEHNKDEKWEYLTLCVKIAKARTGGGEGKTPVTTACPNGRLCERKTPYELRAREQQ